MSRASSAVATSEKFKIVFVQLSSISCAAILRYLFILSICIRVLELLFLHSQMPRHYREQISFERKGKKTEKRTTRCITISGSVAAIALMVIMLLVALFPHLIKDWRLAWASF